MFRLRTRGEVESRIAFDKPPHDRTLVYKLDGKGLDGEPNDDVLVLLNGSLDSVTFDLPDGGGWSGVVDAEQAGAEPFGDASGRVELGPNTSMVRVR